MSLVRVQKHDRYQLELKFEYLSTPIGSNNVELDLWLLLPPVFGVSSGMYTSAQVYTDLRTYTRLKTPRFTISEMLTQQDSPLRVLESTMESLTQLTQKQIRQEMKLFGGIARRLFLNSPSKDVELYKELIERWRQVVIQFLRIDLEAKTTKCIKIIDELISNYWEVYLIERFEDQPDEFFQQYMQTELAYRKSQSYYMFQETCKDQYLFHYGNLTKYVNTVLFLQSKPDRFTEWIRHAALGIAAGLAMVWALFVQIYALIEYGVNLDSQMSLSVILTFVAIGIFSYILKDRIKAASGRWLSDQVSKRLPDHNRLYSISEEHAPMATISERVNILQEASLPLDVLERYRAFKEWNPYFLFAADVLHYRRHIEMYTKKASKQFARFQGIVEIHRFHIWNWIKVLAEPQKDIKVVNEEGQIHYCEAPRVYTVNLVCRVKHAGTVSYQLVRVLMNSRGIIDVEQIDTQSVKK